MLGETVRLGGPVVHVFDVEIPREALLESLARPDRMSPPRTQAGRQRRRLTATEVDLERIRQRALLVGTGVGMLTNEDAEASLDELALLADTAGADPVEAVLQRRRSPDPATYVGKGKAEELRGVGRRARHRRRDLRRRAHARRSSATSKSCSRSTSSTASR